MSDTPEDLPPQLFRLAVEQAALAISITDDQARILYANPSFQRVTGYAREEVIGHNESLLSYKVTPRIVYETLWAQLQRQRPWNGMLVNRRKDGSRYLADVTITPVLDTQGRTTHYLGMHRDVTEVHRLERQVQNQKGLIESVVDAAQVAIALLDAEDRVVLDNQEYKKLIGVLGREPSVTVLTALKARLGAEFEQARELRRAIPARELRFEQGRGGKAGREPLWLACAVSWFEEQEITADAFYEPKRRTYMLLTLQDIGELKRQQEAIRMNGVKALLAEQERIQGLRETLAGAIFQLEGPLNRLQAAVNLLDARGETAANLEESLAAGRAALETLRAAMPADTQEGLQALDLNALLRDVLRLATPRMLADGVVVEWQAAGDLPRIEGRPAQLSNLFKQLIDNAIEAIHEQRGARRELRVSTRVYDDRVEVDLDDSGPGIPEAWRFKVFEPFFTTKGGDVHHPGLGLVMAREAAASHGGFVDVDPDYHDGCRMRVQLPLNPAEVRP
ncbi:MAG: nitrogen fixation negative regulator NifL [Pseudomonadota bacterium]